MNSNAFYSLCTNKQANDHFCLSIVQMKYIIVVSKLWLNGLYFLLKEKLKGMHFLSHVPLVSVTAGSGYDTNVIHDGDRTLGLGGTGSY